MMRWLQILSVVAVTLSAAFVFHVKYRSETVAGQVADLQRAVDQEKEAISLLKAEWSYLIQPARVQDLIDRHNDRFELKPVSPEQIGTFADLPERRHTPTIDLETAGSDPATAAGTRP